MTLQIQGMKCHNLFDLLHYYQNAPCSCIMMFHTVTTKQTETRHHTQMPYEVKVKVEGGQETGISESRARAPKVLIIFAALTVSGFVTKNDVKSYKFDILIVRCTVPTFVVQRTCADTSTHHEIIGKRQHGET